MRDINERVEEKSALARCLAACISSAEVEGGGRAAFVRQER